MEKGLDVKSLRAVENEDKLPATFLFEYHNGHLWYYFSNMKEDELLVLTLFIMSKMGGGVHMPLFWMREGRVPFRERM